MSTNAQVSSVALIELKRNLTGLSATLHEIFDLMNSDMRQIGEVWQDGKYEEFIQSYSPQINKCEDISARYSEWCKRVLEPTIENVDLIERTDVGSGSVGSSFAGGGTAGNAGGGMSTPAGTMGSGMASPANSIGKAFNIGNNTSNPISSVGGIGNAGMSGATPSQSTYDNGMSSAQAKWEKEHGQSLAPGWRIDENGQAVRISDAEATSNATTSPSGKSSSLEEWQKKVLTPSAPNPKNEDGAYISHHKREMESAASATDNGGISPDAQKIVDALEKDKKAQGSAGAESGTSPNEMYAQKIVDALEKDKKIKGSTGAESNAQLDWEEKHQMSLDKEHYHIDEKGNAVPNQDKLQADWEEKHQMSLDNEHYHIDGNGNAVLNTEPEIAKSSFNSTEPQGAMISKMLDDEKAKNSIPPMDAGGNNNDTTSISNGINLDVKNTEVNNTINNEINVVDVNNTETTTNIENVTNNTETVTNNTENINIGAINNNTENNQITINKTEIHNHYATCDASSLHSGSVENNGVGLSSQTSVLPGTNQDIKPVPFPDPKPQGEPVKFPDSVQPSASQPVPEQTHRSRPIPPRYHPSYVQNEPTPRPEPTQAPEPRQDPRLNHGTRPTGHRANPRNPRSGGHSTGRRVDRFNI